MYKKWSKKLHIIIIITTIIFIIITSNMCKAQHQ